jgi:hypothetical protein
MPEASFAKLHTYFIFLSIGKNARVHNGILSQVLKAIAPDVQSHKISLLKVNMAILHLAKPPLA